MLDSMNMSAAFVRKGCLDVLASNFGPITACALGCQRHRCAKSSQSCRFHFLDPAYTRFSSIGMRALSSRLLSCVLGARNPNDPLLRARVGELTALSLEFRTLWASHDIHLRHEGFKRLNHPVVRWNWPTSLSASLRCSGLSTSSAFTPRSLELMMRNGQGCEAGLHRARPVVEAETAMWAGT